MYTGLFAVVILVQMAILVSLWVVFYQLLSQRGRLLVRLDVTEQRLTAVGQIAAQSLQELNRGQRSPTQANPPAMAAARQSGVAVGTTVASMPLLDLSGTEVDLASIGGKRTLLIYWNPGCGFCDMLAPELARSLPELQAKNVEVLLVSHGSTEANRRLLEEHKLECRVWMLPSSESVPEVFQFQGTPTAYLLDKERRTETPLAVGFDGVGALVGEIVDESNNLPSLAGKRTVKDSRIERNGLLAGTPAPTFRLPDINGEIVTLEEYRGRDVLLVFSDPNCGPCDQLAPHLASLHDHQPGDGLSLIMVGRGDAEENRRKAQEHQLNFPVVLQNKWELSKKYGIFATPVAFLINAEGLIVQNVAQGTGEILALVEQRRAVA